MTAKYNQIICPQWVISGAVYSHVHLSLDESFLSICGRTALCSYVKKLLECCGIQHAAYKKE